MSTNWRHYRARLKALSKKLGVIIHEGDGEVNLEAPPGYVFGDIHELVNSPWDGAKPSDMWQAAYKDLRANIGSLRRCDDPECEWCVKPEASNG